MVDKFFVAIDDETLLLKSEIKEIKDEIVELNAKKDELLKQIDSYNYRYNLEFKDILAKILYLRQKNYKDDFIKFKSYYKELYDEFTQNKDELATLKKKRDLAHEDEKQSLNHEISILLDILKKIKKDILNIDIKKMKQDFVDSSNEYKKFKDMLDLDDEIHYELTKDEQLELKRLYKKAARLCHPDIVQKHLKDDAQDLFKELNKAYKDKNIELIREMMIFLKDGDIFSVDSSENDNKSSLKKDIKQLNSRKNIILQEIKFLLSEHEFSFVFSLDEKQHFKLVREQLISLFKELKNNKINPIENEDEWMKKLLVFANKFKIDTKTIPRDKIELQKLRVLDLSSYDLTYLSPAIAKLESLEILNLSSNILTTLPLELSELKNLKELNISYNDFREIPDFLFQIDSLEYLNMSNNSLKTIPKDILKLKKLSYLDVCGNLIEILPEEFYQISCIKSFLARGNKIKKISKLISNLDSLIELNLYSNNLSSLPKEIMKLDNLEEFDVAMNDKLSLSKEQKQWMEKFENPLF